VPPGLSRGINRSVSLDNGVAGAKDEVSHYTGRRAMPMLTVEGVGTFDVPPGKRLVLALEDEAKIDQLHACGGNARCTTCRVEFVSGEPPTMTNGERTVLAAKGLTGVRLSCQITCDHDMTVRAISRFAGSGRKDVGPRPTDTIPPS
jgi:ferredoxin